MKESRSQDASALEQELELLKKTMEVPCQKINAEAMGAKHGTGTRASIGSFR